MVTLTLFSSFADFAVVDDVRRLDLCTIRVISDKISGASKIKWYDTYRFFVYKRSISVTLRLLGYN